MGCDIHLVLERRTKDRSKWVAVNTFEGGHNAYPSKDNDWYSPIARRRNYDRFAMLAGVRGDGPDPKGIPPDASETTKFLIEEVWGADGHSHNYLSAIEAASIFANTEFWGEDKPPECFDRQHPSYYFFGVEWEKAEDYRIVFWFDN